LDRTLLPFKKGVTPRILVTRLRYLGDIILTTPVLDSLGNCFPGAEIWYMAEPPHASILYNHPRLSGVIELGRGIAATMSAIKRLRSLRFSAAIDLFYNPRSANILYLSGIPKRIGGGRRWRRHLYTDIFDPGGSIRNAIEHHLSALESLGCKYSSGKTKIYLTDDERDSGRSLVFEAFDGMMPERVAAIHPGGTWPAKRWPVASFADLIGKIEEDLGVRSIIVTGPGEESITRKVISQCRRSPATLPVIPIRSAAAAIAACGALIANDGGVMHAGVALGVPTIGIFGPTETDMWFPYSDSGPYEVITSGAECAPCHLHECEDLRCLKEISAAEISEGLSRMTGWIR
jgi:ADP-heptose:LPS heptosyltransferase